MWDNWESRRCEICGKPLDPLKRWHSRYCGQNCRKRASRRRAMPKTHGTLVMSHLQMLRMLVKPLKTEPELAKDVADWLKRIQAECRDILILCDPDAKRDHAALVEMVNQVANKRR